MERPDNRRWRRGFLLVEALLSAVVIAVGLVFVSRGLAGQLRALRTLETYDVLLALAEDQLQELEARSLVASSPPRASEGAFRTPHEQYRWKVEVQRREEPINDIQVADITLTVWRQDRPKPVVTLLSVWPASQVPSAWN